eukprot:1138161-Pelagomonas_calceolata.AAC.1
MSDFAEGHWESVLGVLRYGRKTLSEAIFLQQGGSTSLESKIIAMGEDIGPGFGLGQKNPSRLRPLDDAGHIDLMPWVLPTVLHTHMGAPHEPFACTGCAHACHVAPTSLNWGVPVGHATLHQISASVAVTRSSAAFDSQSNIIP